jgi:hypothetical protein
VLSVEWFKNINKRPISPHSVDNDIITCDFVYLYLYINTRGAR